MGCFSGLFSSCRKPSAQIIPALERFRKAVQESHSKGISNENTLFEAGYKAAFEHKNVWSKFCYTISFPIRNFYEFVFSRDSRETRIISTLKTISTVTYIPKVKELLNAKINPQENGINTAHHYDPYISSPTRTSSPSTPRNIDSPIHTPSFSNHSLTGHLPNSPLTLSSPPSQIRHILSPPSPSVGANTKENHKFTKNKLNQLDLLLRNINDNHEEELLTEGQILYIFKIDRVNQVNIFSITEHENFPTFTLTTKIEIWRRALSHPETCSSEKESIKNKIKMAFYGANGEQTTITLLKKLKEDLKTQNYELEIDFESPY